MTNSKNKLNNLIRKGKRTLQEAQQRNLAASKPEPVPSDPVEFAETWLSFKPTPYQSKLLRDKGKRIVVVYPRQSGKTTTLAIRMIHYALTQPRTTSLIVSPGLRQSRIVMDRIQEQISRISQRRRRENLRQKEMMRTTVTFRNSSKIIALPCSPDQLRGYAAHMVLVDEASFIAEDETMFHSVLFPMLQTTDGTMIASSTPWGKDSVFFKFTQDPAFNKHFAKIDEVIKAGLVSKTFIDEMKQRTPSERFRREYLAEFVEDELAYFSYKLIVKCIDSQLTPITEDWTGQVKAPVGRYFLGVDLGKKVDSSVIAIVRYNTKEQFAELVGLVRFQRDTPYGSVIGMVKVICDKLQHVEKILVDQTGVGEYIVEEMKNAGIRSQRPVEGTILTVPSKQEILGYMKHLMETESLSLYYDEELIDQINVERYELAKTGQIQFSHPDGTHDDELWALALAAYATRTPDTSFMTEIYGVPKNY